MKQENVDENGMIDLEHGFYVVKDYEFITEIDIADDEPDEEMLAETVAPALLAGKKVFRISAYSGTRNDQIYLIFSGEIIWQNNELYETSACAGYGCDVGDVPAGRLVIGIDED